MRSSLKLLALSLVCVLNAYAADPLPSLPQLNVTKLGVSGLSSGAAMSVQLGVAYSDRFDVVGVMSGPAYLCALGSASTAVFRCMKLETPGAVQLPQFVQETLAVDSDTLVDETRELARKREIAPVANIANQRVWVVRGSADKVVGEQNAQLVRDFYQAFKAQLAPKVESTLPHTLGTDKPGLGDCSGKEIDPDYVSSCNYDEVGKMFGYLYGWTQRGRAQDGRLKDFDQGAYTVDEFSHVVEPARNSMAPTGRVYVPQACEQGGCKVHVALHGCLQGEDAAFDAFSRLGGYNEWAEANKLVVLYPRVVKNAFFNPAGCWDWWGFSTIGYLTYAKRSAPQMQSIMRMVDALAKPALAER